MANFTTFIKLPSMPVGGINDLSRQADSTLYLGGGKKAAEIWQVTAAAGDATTTYDLPTSMNRIENGYVWSVTDSAIVPAATVIPAGNGSVARVTGLTLSATKTLLVIVYGDKNRGIGPV